jgi:hypothetical protein
MPDENLSVLQRKELWDTFLLQAPELAAHSKKVRELRQPPEYPRTLVLHERPKENPRPTHRHHRGEFLQPKEEVTPGVPAELHGFPAELPKNRLSLAHWLVSPRNPLTARVTVNRHWGAFFGTGIVPTVGDFGLQGAPPTHPELLDWLAIRFAEDGWSVKRLHRTIVTSATYRQTSHVSPESARLDPNNTLLSRAPRFRLEAEVIRDSALLSAGLLTNRTGGPPVRPPQPEGVVEVAYGNVKWVADQGPDRYRRSVFTFQKRTAPFAMLSTFDAPSGEACIARRDVSNSPLQALTLLNDVTFVEAARALGRTLASREDSDRERAEYAFRRVLTRKPTADELDLLAGFVQSQRERLTKGELDAHQLTGEKAGNPIEHAAWTALARALFGLDETITRN